MSNSISTFTLLAVRNRLQAYTNRTLTTDGSTVDDIFFLWYPVKKRMDYYMRVPRMENKLTLAGTDFPNYTLPDDFLEVKELIYIDANSPYRLDPAPTSEVEMLKVAESGDKPNRFTITGDGSDGANLLLDVGPTPASTDSFILVYYQRPDDLNANINGANLYTSVYLDVVIAGCLMEYYYQHQDLERGQFWEQKFMNQIQEANVSEGRAEFAGSTLYVRNS